MDLKKLGNKNPSGKGQSGEIYDSKGIFPAVMCGGGNPNRKRDIGYSMGYINVSMQTNGINTQHKSMKKTLEINQIPEISQQSMFATYPTATCSQVDFLARLSQLLEKERDLKILEALSFLKSQGYSQPKELDIYCLKMSQDSYRMIGAEHFKSYSQPLMNWGMTFNGKCLTARISEFHRIGKECSLSDILEENVDQKYFLSEKTIQKMIAFNQRKIDKGHGFRVSIQDMDNGGVGKDISQAIL